MTDKEKLDWMKTYEEIRKIRAKIKEHGRASLTEEERKVLGEGR